MNLYRSFGSLLETWVTEGYPILDSQGQPSGGVEVEELVEVVSGGQVDAFRSSTHYQLLVRLHIGNAPFAITLELHSS